MDGGLRSEAPRRRPRESETESQKIKREKAAERQRRKRERDRKNAGMGVNAFSSGSIGDPYHPLAAALQQQQQAQAQQLEAQAQQQVQQAQAQAAAAAQMQQQGQVAPGSQAQQAGAGGATSAYGAPPELTPEEVERRDRVRAAARERQRKHRLLVKQRRMRDLGLDMGNEIMTGMDEVHYRAAPDGQYHQVIPPEMQQQLPPPPPPPHPPLPPHEPPFPQGAPLGGQTFASTLLLSFSCAPLLKQHLLRTLNMSNEELASLEPIIAEAWDRWDHQRRLHYAEQVAKNGGQPPGLPPQYAVEMAPHDPNAPPPHPFPASADPNDFRARFHRSIIAPAPFRTAFGETPAPTTATPPAAGTAPAESIDPHLATATNGASAAPKS